MSVGRLMSVQGGKEICGRLHWKHQWKGTRQGRQTPRRAELPTQVATTRLSSKPKTAAAGQLDQRIRARVRGNSTYLALGQHCECA